MRFFKSIKLKFTFVDNIGFESYQGNIVSVTNIAIILIVYNEFNVVIPKRRSTIGFVVYVAIHVLANGVISQSHKFTID